MQSFDGKVALVTGAGRGIGKAVAFSLAKLGCRVVLAARTSGELEKVKLDIQNDKGIAIAVPTDLTRDEDIDRLVRESEREFGAVDILINNAGWGKRAPVVRAKI
jgi:NAD(P)-dependent dehydrogenase (short-subunit alcohol dehydrogenase family)